MAQEHASKPEIVRVKGLGPGFWPVTLLLLALSIIQALYFLYGNIDWIMSGSSDPVANVTYDIDGLFKFMAVFGNAILIFVAGYVIYFAIVFRARPTDTKHTIGVPIHESPKLELWWTVLPSILLVLLVAYSIVVWNKIYFGTGNVGLTAEVVGHQFYFEYRYPGLKKSIVSKSDAFHIPVGVPVRLLISSADVIHQFWIPEIRIKAAAVPGLVTEFNFTAKHPGTYFAACSEFCGPDHSLMTAKVIIEPVSAFNAWLENEKKAAAVASTAVDLSKGTADAGKAVYAQKCAACHTNPPSDFDHKLVGPGLLKITDDPAHPNLVNGKPPTPENIAGILTDGFTGPLGSMPNRQANALSDADIANLVAYLVSLK